MDFFLLSSIKLKITLTPEDLDVLGVSYESLDYNDPRTRRVLLTLLERSKKETAFSPKKSKLFIEVLPTEEGGCVLYFTCLGPGKKLAGAQDAFAPSAVIFTFEDFDELAQAASKVFGRYSHRIYKSSLYRVGESYRLVVYPLDYADHLSISFLSEFAPKTGEGQVLAAWIAEHGTTLIEDTALDELARYFG